MAIPKASSDRLQVTKSFQAMQSVYDALQAEYSFIDTLSMGMSSDLALAIESNTTMVRIGTAIFGARN